MSRPTEKKVVEARAFESAFVVAAAADADDDAVADTADAGHPGSAM